MDNKRNLPLMLAMMALIMGFVFLQQHYRDKYHIGDQQTPPPAQPAPAGGPTPPATTTTNPAAPGTPGVAAGPAGWRLMPAPSTGPAPRLAVLGSAVSGDKTWALQLNLDPRGAALSSVVLNRFKRSADFKLPEKERRAYVFQEPDPDVAGSDALATRWVNVNGAAVDLLHADWSLEPQPDATAAAPAPAPAGAKGDGGASVTYSTTLADGDKPGLRISKTFTVYPIQSSQGGEGYEVRVVYGLTNLSGDALTVKAAFNGPTLPPREGGRGADRQIIAGYRHDGDIAVEPHAVEEFRKEKLESMEVSKSEKGPMAWTGPCSVYFNALVLPLKNDPDAKGDAAVGDFIEKVTAQGWLFDKEIDAQDRPVTLTFETTGQTLAAHQSVSLPMDVYFGPKWRQVVNAAHYAAAPRRYDETLVLKSGWCGTYCTFDPLIKLMVLLLTAFHWVAGGFGGHGDWGIAIIMLVGTVRLILHPITKKSQVQMMKMGKMAPEMERLKQKYGDDKDELNKAMVQFYKENGAGQLLGCLPMFLQMPIWIALYSSLQTTFEMRQSPFLWGWTWIQDLSKPDLLIPLGRHAFTLPLLITSLHVEGLNLLPILMGVVFFLQQKYLTPPNPAATEQQLQQQKMMQVLYPIMFPLMLYTSPSGLNLYIFASTLFGVIESRVIRKHIKEREEAEKATRVMVDTKPTRQGKMRSRNETPEPAKRGFWADLQARVDEARREQKRRGKDGKR